jgi:hypothetical protein
MKRLVSTLLFLALLAVSTAADDKPSLPRVPRGFDEGRTAFVAETADALVLPGALIERLFEEADLHDLATFIHRHLLADEKRALGETLALVGLANCKDQPSVLALLGVRKPAEVAKAIGAMLVARKYTLSDVGAWLYARGFNFRVLQRALNGERLDAFRLRRQLRAMPDHSAAKVFVPGLWEFNLNDSREEKGGIYDGAQLVEILLAIGWKSADFARAVGVKELPEARRKLVEWGDAALIWTVLENYVSESELVESVVKHYKAADDPKVFDVALARASTTSRWLRTGGPGVVGVYRGPWPTGKGDPMPPTSQVIEIGEADAEQFADALSEQVRNHFKTDGDTITLVVYEDGSARALLDKLKREPLEYHADTPFGEIKSTRQAYEGRVSISGRNGLLYLAFADQVKAAPSEFELANVQLAAGGAFLAADIDDGLNLTPILLRRMTRLVD